MQLLKLPWIVTIAVILWVTTGYIGYTKGYDTGHTKATLDCGVQLQRMKNTLDKINAEALKLEQQQKQSYSVALTMRNDQYNQINHRLRIREAELRRKQNESAHACDSHPIRFSFD